MSFAECLSPLGALRFERYLGMAQTINCPLKELCWWNRETILAYSSISLQARLRGETRGPA